MKKHKVITIAMNVLSILLIFTIVSFIFIKTNKEKSYNDKYSINISVNLTNKDSTYKILNYEYNFDGINGNLVSSNITNEIVYFIRNEQNYSLIYKDNNLYKIYKTEYSPSNILKHLMNYKLNNLVEEISDSKLYKIKAQSKSINSILQSLYIDINLDKSVNINSSVLVNNEKSTYTFYIENATDYENINIVINLQKLDNEFLINVPTIDKNISEYTDKNILQVS